LTSGEWTAVSEGDRWTETKIPAVYYEVLMIGRRRRKIRDLPAHSAVRLSICLGLRHCHDVVKAMIYGADSTVIGT
jgi:hypothetical protein